MFLWKSPARKKTKTQLVRQQQSHSEQLGTLTMGAKNDNKDTIVP